MSTQDNQLEMDKIGKNLDRRRSSLKNFKAPGKEMLILFKKSEIDKQKKNS